MNKIIMKFIFKYNSTFNLFGNHYFTVYLTKMNNIAHKHSYNIIIEHDHPLFNVRYFRANT